MRGLYIGNKEKRNGFRPEDGTHLLDSVPRQTHADTHTRSSLTRDCSDLHSYKHLWSRDGRDTWTHHWTEGHYHLSGLEYPSELSKKANTTNAVSHVLVTTVKQHLRKSLSYNIPDALTFWMAPLKPSLIAATLATLRKSGAPPTKRDSFRLRSVCWPWRVRRWAWETNWSLS